MNPNGLRARILNREVLSGTFIKTPAYEIMEVMKQVGDAAARHGKAGVTFQANTARLGELKDAGISMFFIGSEHTFMLNAAKQVAADIAAAK